MDQWNQKRIETETLTLGFKGLTLPPSTRSAVAIDRESEKGLRRHHRALLGHRWALRLLQRTRVRVETMVAAADCHQSARARRGHYLRTWMHSTVRVEFCSTGNRTRPSDQDEWLAMNGPRSQPRWKKGNPGPGPGHDLVRGHADAWMGRRAGFSSLGWLRSMNTNKIWALLCFCQLWFCFDIVISRLIFWLNLNQWDNLIGGLIFY
jgi:hypothetical protein